MGVPNSGGASLNSRSVWEVGMPFQEFDQTRIRNCSPLPGARSGIVRASGSVSSPTARQAFIQRFHAHYLSFSHPPPAWLRISELQYAGSGRDRIREPSPLGFHNFVFLTRIHLQKCRKPNVRTASRRARVQPNSPPHSRSLQPVNRLYTPHQAK